MMLAALLDKAAQDPSMVLFCSQRQSVVGAMSMLLSKGVFSLNRSLLKSERMAT